LYPHAGHVSVEWRSMVRSDEIHVEISKVQPLNSDGNPALAVALTRSSTLDFASSKRRRQSCHSQRLDDWWKFSRRRERLREKLFPNLFADAPIEAPAPPVHMFGLDRS